MNKFKLIREMLNQQAFGKRLHPGFSSRIVIYSLTKDNRKARARDDSAVGKTPALQGGGPEFDPQTPCKKARGGGICKPSTGEAGTGGPCGLLSSSPCLQQEFQGVGPGLAHTQKTEGTQGMTQMQE